MSGWNSLSRGVSALIIEFFQTFFPHRIGLKVADKICFIILSNYVIPKLYPPFSRRTPRLRVKPRLFVTLGKKI